MHAGAWLLVLLLAAWAVPGVLGEQGGVPGGAVPGSTPCKLDVMIVLDRSGSMDGPPSQAARAGAIRLLENLDPILDQSGVRGFPTQPDDKGLDADHDASIAAVEGSSWGGPFGSPGPTGQSEAMELAYQDLRGGRPDAVRLMFVLSDGVNANTSQVADAAKATGIRIFSIATGDDIDQGHMQAIASRPLSVFYVETNSQSGARDAMDAIQKIVLSCSVTVQASASMACKNGFVRLTATGSINRFVDVKNMTWTFDDGHPGAVTPDGGSHSRPIGDHPVEATVTALTSIGSHVGQTLLVEPVTCPPPSVTAFCTSEPQVGHAQSRATVVAAWAKVTSYRWTVDGQETSASTTASLASDQPVAFVLTVQDELGMSASSTVLCPPRPNIPPTLAGATRVVLEGQGVGFTLQGGDLDPQVLEHGWDLATLPPGATADGGAMRWTTAPGDRGTYGPIRGWVDDGFVRVWADHWVIVEADGRLRTDDLDNDGVADGSDNCPDTRNRDQTDSDLDGRGDACMSARAVVGQTAGDADTDGDGVLDATDVCPSIADAGQRDSDHDGHGDACDLDVDGDAVPNGRDNCPLVPNEAQTDLDLDGHGDRCVPTMSAGPDHPGATDWIATASVGGERSTRPHTLWMGGALGLVLLGLLLGGLAPRARGPWR